MSKVLFDGVTKIISVADGITDLDFQKDVFSPWKDWFLMDTNSRFPLAITTDGGEDSIVTVSGEKGITYLLQHGWKIRPHEGNHRLVVFGNVYTAEGDDPFVETLGNFKVTISMTVSNIIGSSSEDTSAVELEGIGGDEWTVTLA